MAVPGIYWRAGVGASAQCPDASGARARVSGVRTPGADAQRQWTAVRVAVCAGPFVASGGLVDQAGDSARAHSPGPSCGQRTPRADASDAETRDRAPAGGIAARPAAAIQPISAGVQR